MSDLASVRVTVQVGVDAAEAFRVFTEDFEHWYSQGSAALGPRAGGPLRFVDGPEGRTLQTTGAGGAEAVTLARVQVWHPGRRLVFVDHRGTEVDVRFTETAGGGCEVVLEHRGLDRLPPGQAADIARYGWRRLADWFHVHIEERTTT